MEQLKGFTLPTFPYNEKEIEDKLTLYLLGHSVPYSRQEGEGRRRRYDILVVTPDGKWVVEIKKQGTRTCVDQLDKYSATADGIILLCWRGSRPFRQVFREAQRTAKIPLALIEISRNGDMV